MPAILVGETKCELLAPSFDLTQPWLVQLFEERTKCALSPISLPSE